MNDRPRWVSGLLLAGFFAVGVSLFVVCIAIADSSDSGDYRRQPAAVADHLITGVATQGLDAVKESSCVAIPEAEPLLQSLAPDEFVVIVSGGGRKAESVAECLRGGVAERVRLSVI
jgi:hypothetical protein